MFSYGKLLTVYGQIRNGNLRFEHEGKVMIYPCNVNKNFDGYVLFFRMPNGVCRIIRTLKVENP